MPATDPVGQIALEPGRGPGPSDRPGPALLADLGERWARARRAALRGVLGDGYADSTPEPDLARAGAVVDKDAALRAVYDNSRKLGTSFARFAGMTPNLPALTELVSTMPIPCIAGRFDEQDTWARLTRSGCAVGGEPAVCDHYREALDGLVLGLSGGLVRFARHRSRGAGDAACVDVLFESTTDGPPSPLRLGPIPDDVAAELASIRRTLALMSGGAKVAFLGLSEGLVYFELTDDAAPGALNLTSMLERSFARRLPHLRLVNASPRAVLAG